MLSDVTIAHHSPGLPIIYDGLNDGLFVSAVRICQPMGKKSASNASIGPALEVLPPGSVEEFDPNAAIDLMKAAGMSRPEWPDYSIAVGSRSYGRPIRLVRLSAVRDLIRVKRTRDPEARGRALAVLEQVEALAGINQPEQVEPETIEEETEIEPADESPPDYRRRLAHALNNLAMSVGLVEARLTMIEAKLDALAPASKQGKLDIAPTARPTTKTAGDLMGTAVQIEMDRMREGSTTKREEREIKSAVRGGTEIESVRGRLAWQKLFRRLSKHVGLDLEAEYKRSKGSPGITSRPKLIKHLDIEAKVVEAFRSPPS